MSDSLRPEVVKIVGGATASSWVQVFLSEENPLWPQVFFSLAVESQGEEEATMVGKELAQHFLQQFSQTEKKTLENLREAIEKLVIQAQEKNVLADLSCGVLRHGCLYAATYGEDKIYFQRGKNFVELLQGEKGQTKSISGFVEEHDLVILCSASFSSLVSSQTLLANLDHKPLEDIVEALSPVVLGSPDSSLAASLFVKFKRVVPEEKISAPEPNQEKPADPKTPGLKVLLPKFSLPLVSNFLLPNWKKSLATDAGKLSFSPSRSQKTILTVAVAFLILLAVSVVFGLQKKQQEKDHALYLQVYDDSKAKIEEGKAIIDLNPTLARSLLAQGKTEASSVLGQLQNKNSSDYKTLVGLSKQADDLLIAISRVYRVSSPEIFYDLVLVKDKASGSRLSLSQNSLAILDSSNKAVYALQTDTKAAQVVAGGPTLSQSLLVGTRGDIIDVFSPVNGVVEVKVTDKVSKTVIRTDSSWGQINSLVDFSGNIYLLDSQKGKIIKYVATDNGYSDAKNYLRPDVTPDFSKSVSMAIDGSVWVLNSLGTISKFTQGQPDNFNISGLDVGFSSPKAIFTSDEAKNIYILDTGNKRVVVLGKTGEYVAQYQWSGISKVTDLVADEKLGKMLLLSGSKIYSINLK